MSDAQLESSDDFHWIHTLLDGVFAIADITMGAMGGHAIRVRGRFAIDDAQAYERLAPLCRARGRTLMVRRENEDVVLILARGVVEPGPNRRWLPIILAVATVVSMLFSYVLFWEATELSWRSLFTQLPKGLAFTASLLAILVTHEFGHYFMARHFGVAATLPYLIPFPLSPFGTMGAVIRMKSIPPTRRAMLLIGAAGPVAGLLCTIPILILGLSLSEVTGLPSGSYVLEGNSLLYGLSKLAMFGRWLPSGGEDVFMHPVAFAGWAGLLVTSLNLIPAGQLDGGHAAQALLGAKTRYLTWAIVVVVLALGILWRGWIMWAALILIFSRTRVSPLNDISPLTRAERVLAVALMVLFLLTFTPIPLQIIG